MGTQQTLGVPCPMGTAGWEQKQAPRRVWRRHSVPPLQHTPPCQSGVIPAPLWLLGPAPKTLLAKALMAPEVEGTAKNLSATVVTNSQVPPAKGSGGPAHSPCSGVTSHPQQEQNPRRQGPRTPMATRARQPTQHTRHTVPSPSATRVPAAPRSRQHSHAGINGGGEAMAFPTALPTPRVWAGHWFGEPCHGSTHAQVGQGARAGPQDQHTTPWLSGHSSHLPKPCLLRPA